MKQKYTWYFSKFTIVLVANKFNTSLNYNFLLRLRLISQLFGVGYRSPIHFHLTLFPHLLNLPTFSSYHSISHPLPLFQSSLPSCHQHVFPSLI